MLAEKFAVFFSDKVSKIREALDEDRSDVRQAAPPAVGPDCVLDKLNIISEEAIRKLIGRSPSKSCLLDPIPTWMLKDPDVLRSVLPLLTESINNSLMSGSVPLSLKTAVISPLLKKHGLDPNNLGNYRPVSNLPFAAKVLEKVVAHQLSQHMTANKLHEPYQSAYRSGHSTETALLKITSDINLALDQGDGILLVLLDLSAAFDTIDHEILLERLRLRCGITGSAFEWIQSYLTNRTQSVIIGETLSKSRDLKTGVPQGSVLGPLLFSIYLLPLGDIQRKHAVDYHGYADDSQLQARFNPKNPDSLTQAIHRLERCVDDIFIWMVTNKLKLNEAKTEFMVIVPPCRKQVVQQMQPRLRVGNTYIIPTETARNLGVVIDSEMSMRQQVGNITRAAYYHLHCISRIRRYLDEETCATIVRTLVISRLDYANSVLAELPNKLIQKLQLVQNNAARLITRTGRRAHITPVLCQLHWLPVQQRIKYKIACVTFKALHEESSPSYLQELLHHHQATRALRSNSDTRLTVPRTRRCFGDRAFAVVAPKLWNSLPGDLKSCVDYPVFRRILKTFLFKQYYF